MTFLLLRQVLRLLRNMFSLVRFAENELYVCESKNVSNTDETTKTCTIKYSNGGKYSGTLLQKNDNLKRLKEKKRQLERSEKVNSKTQKTSIINNKKCTISKSSLTRNKLKIKLKIPKGLTNETSEIVNSTKTLHSNEFSANQVKDVINVPDNTNCYAEIDNEKNCSETESGKNISNNLHEETEVVSKISCPIENNMSDNMLQDFNINEEIVQINIDGNITKKNEEQNKAETQTNVSIASEVNENANETSKMVNSTLILQQSDRVIANKIKAVTNVVDNTNCYAEIDNERNYSETESGKNISNNLHEETEVVSKISCPIENNNSDNLVVITNEDYVIAQICNDILLNVNDVDETIDLVDKLNYTHLSLSENERSLLQAIDVDGMNLNDEDSTLETKNTASNKCNIQSTVYLNNSTSKNTDQNKKKIMANILNNVIAGAPRDTTLTLLDRKSKKHNCFYCDNLVIKMGRHLELCHSDEQDVKAFLKLPKGSRERFNLIAEIRKKGDYNHNTKETLNSGNLIVRRLPNKHQDRRANDYIACAKCKGYYMRSNVRHHFVKCTDNAFKGERSTNILCRMVNGQIHESANKIVKKEIFPYIQDGPIKDAIRYDELLILYANILSEKYSHENFSMIRSKLRFLGRFFIAIKEMCNEILDFASIYRPKHFRLCLKAASIVGGYNEDTEQFKAPTNILALGNILKQIGKFLETLYIEREDNAKQKMTKDFVKLIAQGFQAVNRKALEARIKQNRQKKVKLPCTDDIIKLNTFLNKNRMAAYNKLQQIYSYKQWLFLSEICLVELQLFNRRRQGEISKATINDFNSCEGIDKKQNADMFNSLPKKCQEIANSYLRFTIRGKLGRTVTVLIHKNIKDCINLILQYRTNAGIPEINEYLFALPTLDENRQHKHIIACDVLRKFSKHCGASSPDTLRGTTLRKQIATMCADLQLEEQEISDLANYLGHAGEIHKKYYRQPLISREICKMSQILESATPSLHRKKPNIELNSSDISNEFDSRLTEESIDDPISLQEIASNKSEDLVHNKKQENSKKRKVIHSENKKKCKKAKYITTAKEQYTSSDSEFSCNGESSEDESTEELTREKPTSKKKSSKSFIPRVRWSDEEKVIVENAFEYYLRSNTLPSITECKKLIEKYKSAFNGNRTAVQIKAYINNKNKKKNIQQVVNKVTYKKRHSTSYLLQFNSLPFSIASNVKKTE
ncbi:uncharacterized protein [Prorops nasuta]|uniref:uncharacterized protein n=1 Tax=Prorops nasuta TaxID=863751 RepID=UPI0034CE8861